MELQKLMMSDVAPKEGTSYIRRGKGGRPRVVIFGPATSDALRRYLRAVKSTRAKHREAAKRLPRTRPAAVLAVTGPGGRLQE